MKPHIREVFNFFFFLPKMILLEREFLETVAIAGGFRFCGGIFLGGWYPKGCYAKRMVLKRFSLHFDCGINLSRCGIGRAGCYGELWSRPLSQDLFSPRVCQDPLIAEQHDHAKTPFLH